MANSIEILVEAKDQASHVLKNVGDESKSLGEKLKSVAGPLAAVAAGFLSFKGLESAVETTAELGGEIRKLSRETGLGAEEASRLRFAAHELGIDNDTLSKSFGILSKNLLTAREEFLGFTNTENTFGKLMDSLGVATLTTTNNIRPLTDVLNDLADKFKSMPNGVEKTGIAMQAFGRGGKDMIPILNLGSEGIRELAKEADHLGLVLSADNLETTRQYTRSQREMNAALAGLKVEIGIEVMPVLTKFAQWFTSHQSDIRSFFADGIKVVKQFAGDFVAGLNVIKEALSWIPDNKAQIVVAIAAIGAAMMAAWGPSSAAFIGLAALVALMGKIKTDGINLGPLGTLGGQGPKGPSELAQLYAAKSVLETGDVPEGQKDALHAYNSNSSLPSNIDEINNAISRLEKSTEGGQPKVEDLTVAVTGLDSALSPLPESGKKAEDTLSSFNDALKSALEDSRISLDEFVKLNEQAAKDKLPALTQAQVQQLEATSALAAASLDAKEKAWDFENMMAKLKTVFAENTEAGQKLISTIAKETLEKLKSAASALFANPTQEEAALQLKLAQLESNIAGTQFATLPGATANVDRKKQLDLEIQTMEAQKQRMEASHLETSGIEAAIKARQMESERLGSAMDKIMVPLERQREELTASLQVLTAEHNVRRAVVTAADASLLREGEQASAAKDLADWTRQASQAQRDSVSTWRDLIPELQGALTAVGNLRRYIDATTGTSSSGNNNLSLAQRGVAPTFTPPRFANAGGIS